VLRGPQGTTFGKNTTAGLVSIVTADPTANWSGQAMLQAGQLGRRHYEGALAGPIVDDVLQFRVAYIYDKRDGFVKNTAKDESPDAIDPMRGYDHKGYRAKLKFPDLFGTDLKLSYESVDLDNTGAGIELWHICAAFRAFNRWLQDDWGFNHEGRIYAAPYITLVDVDWAVRELEWALERDARVVVMRAGPVETPAGGQNPADARFDPFWSRVAEAGITAAYHSGDSGYLRFFEAWGIGGDFQSFDFNPLRLCMSPAPIMDTMAALVCGGLFDRHPRLRVATIETGSSWVAQRADQGVLAVEHQIADAFSLRVEAFRKHVWVSPYFYENLLDPLVPLPELEVDRVRVAPRGASAYGIETTLRWQPPLRWSGWLAYSWTESQDEFPGVDVPRTWDQRNAVNAGLAWTRRPWQLSGTVQSTIGMRMMGLRVVDATTGELELLPRNGLTYPRTLSLDLRATWTLPLRASALHFYADMGNAGNRRTPCCTEYRLVDDAGAWSLRREYDSTFPRYVLLGVNWEIP